jgi:uncharacterized iron-regulated protein
MASSPFRSNWRMSLQRAALAGMAAVLGLAGCAADGQAVGRTDVLLLGERHDAPGQGAWVADTVRSLAAQGRLAALALEMAPEGSTTVALGRDADEAAVRGALHWDQRAWPWERYGPAAMAAVAAGVPVLGANLPAAGMAAAMADVSLDAQLAPESRALQETAIREGHCGLLPERQIGPMTRVQIARDRSMAHVLAESVRPGKTVVLWSGAGHADRRLGVPQHLPTALSVRSVALVAQGDATPGGSFDSTWTTPAAAQTDPCGDLRRRLAARSPAG